MCSQNTQPCYYCVLQSTTIYFTPKFYISIFGVLFNLANTYIIIIINQSSVKISEVVSGVVLGISNCLDSVY